jgi:predicted AlkP superfamily phosphohydrolase/phosphomutase
MMSSEKVFILGLDGASPEIIESLITLGKLPTFSMLRREGVMGRLRTTIPPITGSAWSSFMTGKNPGKHGIFDFICRKEGTYRLTPINARKREGRAIWSLASDAGKRVCVYNVPVTYPPEKVNGVVVSGMLTPPNRTDYTYPVGLAKELDRVTQGYPIHIAEAYSRGQEERFLKHLYEVTEKRIRAMEYLFRQEDWDLFVGIVEGIDIIQHELWHCWDASHFRHPDSSGRYSDVIAQYYGEMDDLLRNILEDWIGPQRTLIIMSDHGAGPLKKLLYLNNFLMKKGFLRLKRGFASSFKHLLFRSGFVPMTFYHLLLQIGLGRIKKKTRFGQKESYLRPFFLSFEDVEWTQTKAYSFGSTAGQIYLNLKDREPQGIVSPGREAEEVREEIMEDLRNLVDEETGERVIGEIYRKEDLYQGPHLKEAPDIVFLPKSLEIVAFGEYEFASHRVMDYSWGVSGSHRMDGLLMMRGKTLKQGTIIEGAHITDLAPSILYLLGLSIPDSMDGKVLEKAFLERAFEEKRIQFVKESPSSSLSEEIYSHEEEEELKKQLKGLGYL